MLKGRMRMAKWNISLITSNMLAGAPGIIQWWIDELGWNQNSDTNKPIKHGRTFANDFWDGVVANTWVLWFAVCATQLGVWKKIIIWHVPWHSTCVVLCRGRMVRVNSKSHFLLNLFGICDCKNCSKLRCYFSLPPITSHYCSLLLTTSTTAHCYLTSSH